MSEFGTSEFPETEAESMLSMPATPTGLGELGVYPPSPLLQQAESPRQFLTEPFGAAEVRAPFSQRIVEAMQLRVLPSILLRMVETEAKAGTMDPVCADALMAFLRGSHTVNGTKGTLPAVQACADTSLSGESVRSYLTWVLRSTAANQMEVSGPEQQILEENLPEGDFKSLVQFRVLLLKLRRATPVTAPPGRGLSARPSVSVSRTLPLSSTARPPSFQPSLPLPSQAFPSLGRGGASALTPLGARSSGLGLGARLGFRPQT